MKYIGASLLVFAAAWFWQIMAGMDDRHDFIAGISGIMSLTAFICGIRVYLIPEVPRRDRRPPASQPDPAPLPPQTVSSPARKEDSPPDSRP